MSQVINAQQLSEGFEGTALPPEGWTMLYANANHPSDNDMTLSTDAAHSGSQSFRFSSWDQDSRYDEYLITPELSVTSGDQSFSFWYCNYDTSPEVFSIGWSSTGTNVATDFTWSSDVSATSTSWQQFIKTDLPVGTKYVCIHYKTEYGYYLYIDDVAGPAIFVSANDAGITSIDTPATQFLAGTKQIKATIKNYGTNNLTSATIKWAVDAGNGYVSQTDYSWTGDLATGSSEEITIGSYDFSAGGTFSIKVYPVLPNGNTDEDNSNDTSILSVNSVTPVDVPYSQGFENGFPPYGWIIANEGTGNNWMENSSGYSGNCMKYLYNKNEAASAWAYSTFINLVSGRHYKIEFYERVSYALSPEKLKLTIGQGQNVAAQSTTLWYNNNLIGTTWQKRTVTYVSPSSGVYNFAFECYSDADRAAVYVDQVKVFEQYQYDLKTEKITEDTTIAASTSGNYYMKLDNPGYSDDTYNLSVEGAKQGWTYQIEDKTNSNIISNLSVSAEQNDTCLLKVIPPAGITEMQIDTVNFIATSQGDATKSDTIKVITKAYPPYTEVSTDFESGMPEYWTTKINSTSNYSKIEIQNIQNNAHSGSRYVYFYNSGDANAKLYLITPAMKGTAKHNRIKFWATGENDTLFVGIVTDLNNLSDFISLDTAIVASSYKQFSFDYTAPASTYFVVFRPRYTATYKKFNIDDIDVGVIRPTATVYPLDSATNVVLKTEVKAIFDTTVTINDVSGVTISGATQGSVGGINVSLESDNKTLTIAHNSFVVNDQYTVTIPADAVQNADNAGNKEIKWTFETVAYSSDASLSDLTVNGATVAGFNADSLHYSVELPYGTTTVPTVVATPADSKATVKVTDASSLPGTTTIDVTAEDGTTTEQYSIDFTVNTTAIDELAQGLTIYPNPTNGVFFIKSDKVLNNVLLLINDSKGKLILAQKLNSNNNKVDISGFSSGIYLIQLISKDNKIFNYKISVK